MDLTTTILYVLVVANAVFSWFVYRKLQEMATRHHRMVSELNLNTKLADLFSGNVDHENVHTLATHLFHHAKKRYRLTANNHSEMVRELRVREDIDEKLRDAMVDFFENMMLISYKKDNLSDDEKADLKKKIKLIVDHLQHKKE